MRQGGAVVTEFIMFVGGICRTKPMCEYLIWRGRGEQGSYGSTVGRLIKANPNMANTVDYSNSS